MSYITDLINEQETLLALNATYASVITNDAAQLNALLTDPNPKPNYNIDGQSVSWADYQAMLQRSIEQMQNAIKTNMETLNILNTLIQQQQPYQFTTLGL